MKKILLVLLILSLFSVCFGKLYKWAGTSGNGNWRTTALWDLNDGTYPGLLDTAYLDNTSVFPCSLKTSDSVGLLKLFPNYSGAFSMGLTSANILYLNYGFIDSGITGVHRYGGGFYGVQGGITILIAPTGSTAANNASLIFQGIGNNLINHKGAAVPFYYAGTIGTTTSLTTTGTQNTYLTGPSPVLLLNDYDTLTMNGTAFDLYPTTNGDIYSVSKSAVVKGTSNLIFDLALSGKKYTFPYYKYLGSGNVAMSASSAYNDTIVLTDTFDINIRQLTIGGSAANSGLAFYGNNCMVRCGTLKMGATLANIQNNYFGNNGNSIYNIRVLDLATYNGVASTNNDYFGNAFFNISGNVSIGSLHTVSKDSAVFLFRPTDTTSTLTTANKTIPDVIIRKNKGVAFTLADSLKCDSLINDSGKVSFAGKYVKVNKTYKNNNTKDTTNVAAIARVFGEDVFINDTAVVLNDTCKYEFIGTTLLNAKDRYLPDILINGLSFGLQSELRCKSLVDSIGIFTQNKKPIECTANLKLLDTAAIDTSISVWKNGILGNAFRPNWMMNNAVKFQHSPYCTVTTTGNRWGNIFVSKTRDSRATFSDTLKCKTFNHESGVLNAVQPMDVR